MDWSSQNQQPPPVRHLLHAGVPPPLQRDHCGEGEDVASTTNYTELCGCSRWGGWARARCVRESVCRSVIGCLQACHHRCSVVDAQRGGE